eukprot:2917-Pleurochrysis_carterae.AAC.10
MQIATESLLGKYRHMTLSFNGSQKPRLKPSNVHLSIIGLFEIGPDTKSYEEIYDLSRSEWF